MVPGPVWAKRRKMSGRFHASGCLVLRDAVHSRVDRLVDAAELERLLTADEERCNPGGGGHAGIAHEVRRDVGARRVVGGVETGVDDVIKSDADIDRSAAFGGSEVANGHIGRDAVDVLDTDDGVVAGAVLDRERNDHVGADFVGRGGGVVHDEAVVATEETVPVTAEEVHAGGDLVVRVGVDDFNERPPSGCCAWRPGTGWCQCRRGRR